MKPFLAMFLRHSRKTGPAWPPKFLTLPWRHAVPFALLSTALLPISCSHSNQPSEPEKHYAMSGEVISLNAKDQTATVKAGPIKGWMDAMTMEFPVKSKSDFDSLRVGEKIQASVDVRGDIEYSLSHIQQRGSEK